MEDLATDIGSRIRRAREKRGLTIHDLANTTKISTTALTAIEHNDFARLPGGVFRRAYVRAVATEVGLDADELTREYCARFESDIAPRPLPPPESEWFERVRPFYRWSAVLVTLGIMIGGSVLLQRARFSRGSPDARLTLNSVGVDRTADAAPVDERDASEAVVAANQTVGKTERSLQLNIRLERLCWVSAVADGERVVHRLMQPGERMLIEAHRLITLRVGDAGAVAYSLNGATDRPLGSNGDVVTVRISADDDGRLSREPESAARQNGTAIRLESEEVGGRLAASGQRAVIAMMTRPSDTVENPPPFTDRNSPRGD